MPQFRIASTFAHQGSRAGIHRAHFLRPPFPIAMTDWGGGSCGRAICKAVLPLPLSHGRAVIAMLLLLLVLLLALRALL